MQPPSNGRPPAAHAPRGRPRPGGPPQSRPFVQPGPLTLGGYLTGVFGTPFHHPRATLAMAAPMLVLIPLCSIVLLLIGAQRGGQPSAVLTEGYFAVLAVALGCAGVISVAGLGQVVHHLAHGEKIPAATLVGNVLRRAPALLGLTGLFILGVLILAAVTGLLWSAPMLVFGSAVSEGGLLPRSLLGAAALVLVTLVWGLVFGLGSLYLQARLMPAAAILLTEDRNAIAALRTSWRRSRRQGLRIGGIHLLCALIIAPLMSLGWFLLQGAASLLLAASSPSWLPTVALIMGSALHGAVYLVLWGNLSGITHVDLQRRQHARAPRRAPGDLAPLIHR